MRHVGPNHFQRFCTTADFFFLMIQNLKGDLFLCFFLFYFPDKMKDSLIWSSAPCTAHSVRRYFTVIWQQQNNILLPTLRLPLQSAFSSLALSHNKQVIIEIKRGPAVIFVRAIHSHIFEQVQANQSEQSGFIRRGGLKETGAKAACYKQRLN